MSEPSVSVGATGLVTPVQPPPTIAYTPKVQPDKPGVPLWAKAAVIGGAVIYCIGIPYLMYKLVQLIIHLI